MRGEVTSILTPVGRRTPGVLVLTAALLLTTRAVEAQTTPVVATDRAEYLLGSTVHVLGTGFAPGEAVTLQVHRATTILEQGHAAFDPVQLLADGTGRVAWTWSLVDGIGINFYAVAVGATSGPAAEPAAFHRVAHLRTDKRVYSPGNTAHVTGVGFAPGSAVVVSMEAAQPLVPGPVTADASGRIATAFTVDANPNAASHRVEAFAGVDAYSWLSAMAGFDVTGALVPDDGGPNDVPQTWFHWREDDLLYFRSAFRRDITPRALDVTIGWNASWMYSYNIPTIYLDTNGNGRIDVAIAHEVEGDPIDNRRFAFPYSCDDSSVTTCANWNYLPGTAGQSWFMATQGTIAQNLVVALPALGLPADADEPVIVNVCESAGDCVVTPGSGFLSLEVTIPAGTATTPLTVNLAAGTARSGASSWTITPAPLKQGAQGGVSHVSMAPGSYELNAEVPAGWMLTAAGCRVSRNAVSSTSPPVAGPATAALAGVVIEPGQVTRCKFVAEPAAQPTWQ